MKVLNERQKKTRQLALMNLNVGTKKEKEAARRFLLDIGLSADTVDDLEGKGEVEESLKEEMFNKINSVESAQSLLKAKKINFNKTEKVGNITVFKQDDVVVGEWNPSWGNIRTGKDLTK
jgi:hypothetical protein